MRQLVRHEQEIASQTTNRIVQVTTSRRTRRRFEIAKTDHGQTQGSSLPGYLEQRVLPGSKIPGFAQYAEGRLRLPGLYAGNGLQYRVGYPVCSAGDS